MAALTIEQQRQIAELDDLEQKKKLAELITLGKEGKLWRLECVYRTELGATGRRVLTNQTSNEILRARETMFSHGLLLPDPDEAGHYWVINPKDILSVDLWRQARYFDGR